MLSKFKVQEFVHFLLSFIFTFLVNNTIFTFLVNNTRSCLLTEIRGTVCISKYHRTFYISFSRMNSDSFLYFLTAWSNFNLLRNYQWVIFPTQRFFVFFCSSLLQSLYLYYYHYSFFTSANADGLPLEFE